MKNLKNSVEINQMWLDYKEQHEGEQDTLSVVDCYHIDDSRQHTYCWNQAGISLEIGDLLLVAQTVGTGIALVIVSGIRKITEQEHDEETHPYCNVLANLGKSYVENIIWPEYDEDDCYDNDEDDCYDNDEDEDNDSNDACKIITRLEKWEDYMASFILNYVYYEKIESSLDIDSLKKLAEVCRRTLLLMSDTEYVGIPYFLEFKEHHHTGIFKNGKNLITIALDCNLMKDEEISSFSDIEFKRLHEKVQERIDFLTEII